MRPREAESPTWYVVMNAQKARILQDLPPPRSPAPGEIVIEGERRRPREAHGDRPTRSFSSAGGGRRSGVEPGTDPAAEDGRRFLGEVTDYLDRAHREGSFRSLVVVAPDEVLGQWRAQAPAALKTCTRRAFRKNLAGLGEDELVTAIRALLETPREG